jgi:hypothetical protein
MDSSPRSERRQITKPPIRLPETAAEAKALAAWAEAFDDREKPAAPLQLTKHLTFMAATLPSKSQDEETGKMRFAVYSSLLDGHSNEALAYMARRACAELDWFPSPRWCLMTLEQYHPPRSDKVEALSLCHQFWQGRFEDFFFDLKNGIADQETVDAVPLRWRRIALERGFLRWSEEDRRYLLRRKHPAA